MLPMSVAQSSSGMLTIGCIACRQEGGDGSAQRVRSVVYDCLVISVIKVTYDAWLNSVFLCLSPEELLRYKKLKVFIN